VTLTGGRSAAAAGAFAFGLALLGPAGVAGADESAGISRAAEADAGRQVPSRRSASGPSTSPQPAAAQAVANNEQAPAAVARRPVRKPAAATPPTLPEAKATAPNPIRAFLFNRTPTVNPTYGAPDIDGVIQGNLNAVDPDGDALTYTVVGNPAGGQVVIDAAGQFTYTPADPGQLIATDSFQVKVSDAGHGAHLHGLMGLINLLTFGLIGSAGHSTTRTVTLSLESPVDPASYLLPVKPGVIIKPIQNVGDSPTGSPYRMVGAPDGLGVFDNNDGTFTVLMNHELGEGSGGVRAHGARGAFISKWVIDKSTLDVVGGSDLIQRVFTWNSTTQSSNASNSVVSFGRFCSADLAPVSAFSYNGLGTTARIFLNGEEGGSGRAVATVVDGADGGSSYILGTFDPETNGSGLSGDPSWENVVASPYAQEKTVVIGTNDGGSGVMKGALAVYVGTKQSTGTEADKAGLTNGVMKFVKVDGIPSEIADSTTRATNITSGAAFTLSSDASTAFSRPEDGAWNPLNPNEFYFATTDRLDEVSDGVGGQVGQSRLWRLTFADITDPDRGGTIDLLVDGDTVNGTKVNMLDNISVDGTGRVLMQEDTGGAEHNAKIWQYDIATDTVTLVARHDPGRFGDIGIAATSPFNTDEESSGIVDAQSVLGPGWFLLTVMAHYPLSGELVQGGQLLALYDPV
jgi:hypothetical protein